MCKYCDVRDRFNANLSFFRQFAIDNPHLTETSSALINACHQGVVECTRLLGRHCTVEEWKENVLMLASDIEALLLLLYYERRNYEYEE